MKLVHLCLFGKAFFRQNIFSSEFLIFSSELKKNLIIFSSEYFFVKITKYLFISVKLKKKAVMLFYEKDRLYAREF